jgi:hypothetical protein
MVINCGKKRYLPRRNVWRPGVSEGAWGCLHTASSEQATDARQALDKAPVQRFLGYERAGSDNAG